MPESKPQTPTPFGPISDHLIPLMIRTCGVHRNPDGLWVFESEPVTFEKESTNGKGQVEIKTINMDLCVRAYNFELNLLEFGSDTDDKVEKAIKATTNDYMPSKRGYTSYSAMIATYKAKYLGVNPSDTPPQQVQVEEQSWEDFGVAN